MTEMKATYLCIGCPLGCRLEVEEDEDGDIVEVRGFDCKRGKDYAHQEHMAPKRSVSTTVWVSGTPHKRLPVRTLNPVPKESVMQLCEELRQVVVPAPVQMGAVIYETTFEGEDETYQVIACRNIVINDGV
jgi:CxxC motif-containing protein